MHPLRIGALAIFAQLVLAALLPPQGTFTYNEFERPPRNYGNRPSLERFMGVYDVGFSIGIGALGDSASEDLFWLALATYFEARNQSLEDQMAVAQVVLNRVQDERWPKTVREVVQQGRRRSGASWRSCQFSFMCDGLPEQPHNGAAWETARKIAFLVLTRKWPDLSGGATHYHVRERSSPNWTRSMEYVGEAGAHTLWKEVR